MTINKPKLLGEASTTRIKCMSNAELVQLETEVRELIAARKADLTNRATVSSRDELVKRFQSHRFDVNPTTEFYRLTRGEHIDNYGVKVGQYSLDTYPESMILIVLLVVQNNDLVLTEEVDYFLGDPIK
jgi:hypothetical protein